MKPTCPKCGSHEIVTIEQIQGSAGIIDISKGSPEWDGYTEVHWDTTETIGIACARCLYEEMTVDGFDYNDWTKKDVKE